jgi:O-methyltransferase involved in polyketide biosynthesis
MHRSGMVDPALNGVAETLLIPLYNRAMESQRPDAIMKDEKAVALVKQMSYDFDLPDVIGLRRKFIGDEGERYHLLGCSVLDDAWMETLKVHSQRPFLFLAENVFVYFKEAQVKTLVLRLRDHFPGAELVFDGWTPFFVWLGNRQLSSSKFAGLLHWEFWRSQAIEGWGEGVHLLGQWGFFDQPEPRMASFRWMAPIFRLFKPIRIFHFQLGEAAG